MVADDSLLGSVLGTGSITVIGQLASFLGVVAFAQLSTPTILGEYFLLVSVVSVLAFLGTAGVSTNVIRAISRTAVHGEIIGAGLTLVLTAAGLLTVSVGISTPILRPLIGHAPDVIAIALVPAMVGQFGGAVLRGEERPVAAEVIETGRKILTYVLGCGLVLTGVPTYFSFVSGYVAGWVVQTLAAIVLSNVTVSRPSRAEIWSFITESKYLYVSRLSGIGFEWIDTLLLGALAGPSAVAAYEIVWRLSGVANIATNAIVSVYYPRFTALVTDGALEKLRDHGRQSYYYAAVMVLPLLGGGLIVGSELISVAYGEVYRYAATSMVILLIGRLSYTFGRVSTTLFYAHNEDQEAAGIEVMAVAANIVLNILLIPVLGLEGAALATSVSYLTASSVKTGLVYWRYHVPLPAWRLLRAGLAAVLMVGVLIVVPPIDGTSIVRVAARILLGGVVFVGIVVAIDPETRLAIRSIQD